MFPSEADPSVPMLLNGVFAFKTSTWAAMASSDDLEAKLKHLLGGSQWPAEDEAQITELAKAMAATAVPQEPCAVASSVWCSDVGSGKCVLVGDAAHAMHPSLGMGVNSELEDAYLLSLYLSGRVEPGDKVPDGATAWYHFRERIRVPGRVLRGEQLTAAIAAYSALRGREVRALVSTSHIRGLIGVWGLGKFWFYVVEPLQSLLAKRLPAVVPQPTMRLHAAGQVSY